MAIPQTDSNADSLNPAAPVVPPQDAPVVPNPMSLPSDESNSPFSADPVESDETPETMASLVPETDTEPSEPAAVVDLDSEMAIPKDEPVTMPSAETMATPAPEPTPVAEETPIDPNVALQNGNKVEGEIGEVGASESLPPMTETPMPETPAMVTPAAETPEPMPSMTTMETKVEEPMATPTVEPIAEPIASPIAEAKTSMDELPPLGVEDDIKHETPSQDKLEELMATPAETGMDMGADLPSMDEKVTAPKDLKPVKKSGGSGGMMKIVLAFLLLAILGMSAVLAYLLFM